MSSLKRQQDGSSISLNRKKFESTINKSDDSPHTLESQIKNKDNMRN